MTDLKIRTWGGKGHEWSDRRSTSYDWIRDVRYLLIQREMDIDPHHLARLSIRDLIVLVRAMEGENIRTTHYPGEGWNPELPPNFER